MKVKDIVTRVRNTAGDTSVLQFTDQMVLDWINDGVRECAVNNNLLQKRATSSAPVGVSEVTLPTDILKMHSITFDGQKLKGLTLQEWEETNENSTSQGMPDSFYVWAGKIILSPTPDRTGTLVLNYLYQPATLVMNGSALPDVEPAIPTGYHNRLVDYCLAQIYLQDDNINLYQVKLTEFQTGVQQLKDIPEYDNDLYPSISVSARDMGWDF